MDAFAVFSVARRPYLPQDELKKNYLGLLSTQHPDTGSGGDASGLNQAYHILLSDRLRTGHLLELSGVTGLNKAGALPEEYGELLVSGSAVLRESQQLLQSLEQADSALARAGLAGDKMNLIAKLQELQGLIGEWEGQLHQKLLQLDQKWDGNAPDLQALQGVYVRFSFLERWQKQVSEHLFRLLESV